MSITDICRACLCVDRRLHAINDTVFQETWGRLMNSKFNTNDGEPLLVCYICYAHLRKSHQLMKRALKADELLATVINNGFKYSQKTVLPLAGLTHEFDYKYAIGDMCQLECKQFERDTEEEIKTENEADSEEDNEEANDINIKEEEEDSSQEEYLDIADVEPGTPSDDATPLKKILKREVQIVLEKDMGAQTRERKVNEEPPQNAKRIMLDETLKDTIPLTNHISKSLQKKYCKASDVIFLSEDTNVDIYKNKQTLKSTVNCYLENKTSRKVNIQDKNVIVQNNKIITSEVCYSNAKNENVEQCLSKSSDVVAPSTSLDITDEGNDTNNSKKKVSENELSCHICQYKCVTKEKLIIHLCKHTGEKPYKCDLCDYRCSQNSHLKSHVKYKHTKEKNYSCQICQYKFVSKQNLNRHFRKHTMEKPYECDLCDYRCSDPSGLRNHKKFKHTKEKNFSCQICQYKFVLKNNLNRHLRKHMGEKPYKCHLCDYRCLENSDLKSHIKCMHTKEKNFSCQICQCKFVSKTNLNRHFRKHTGEKPYKCDMCDYRCLQNSKLKSHIKCKHSKEKKFSCQICQYKFVSKSNLNKHVRKHTREKPYKCDVCDYTCLQKDNLRTHIWFKHLKEKNFSC